MPRTTIPLTLAILLAASLPACKSSQSPIFFTSPSSPFPDLPIPANFTLLSQNASAGRYTDLSYQSPDDPQPIAQYFASQLPKHGWLLQNQTQSPGNASLQYTKNPDALFIEISNGASVRTTIHIRISPATTTPPR